MRTLNEQLSVIARRKAPKQSLPVRQAGHPQSLRLLRPSGSQRRIRILASFLMLGATILISTFASAQQPALMRPPLETSFLVELADRMVARGEYAEAQSILEKLQLSEPDNPAVQQMLARLKGRAEAVRASQSEPAQAPSTAAEIQTISTSEVVVPSTPTVQSPVSKMVQMPPVAVASTQDLASDIALIQSNIQRHERRNRDLEFLVRNLVQENDVLAQTLAKRNRQLLELMKKVYGDGAELPELNITASVDRNREISSGYEEQIVARDRQLIASNQELSRIDREIAKINAEFNDQPAPSMSAAGSSVIRSASSATIAMDREQTPISRISEQRPAAVVTERKSVPAVPEQRPSPQVEELNRDLKEKRDYLVDKSIAVMDKTRELRGLQNEMSSFAAALKEADDKYAAAVKEYDVKLQDIKASWAEDKTRQQSEINQLKNQLSKKSVELDQLQDKIAAQTPALNAHKQDLALKDEAIAKVDASILAKDKEIIELKGIINEKDKVIAQTKSLLVEKEDVIQQKNVEIEQKQGEIEVKSKELTDVKEVLETKDGEISAKTKELSEVKDDLRVKDNDLAKHKDKLAEQGMTLQFVDDKTRDLQKRVVRIRQSLSDGDRSLDELKMLVANLKARAQAAPAASAQDLEFKSQLDELKVQLDGLMQSLREKEIMIARLKDRALAAPAVPSEDPALKAQVADLKQQLQLTQQSLQKKDNDLTELNAQAARYESAVRERDETLARQRELVRDLEMKLEEAAGNSEAIAPLQTKIAEYEEAFQSQDETLARQREMVSDLEKKLVEARDAETAVKAELSASRQKMELLLENTNALKANAATASERADGLSEKVYNLEDRLGQQVAETAKELRFVKETLAQRDKDVVRLNKDLLSKEEELQLFYRKMNDATKALNANMLSRDQTPTDPSWSLNGDPQGVDFVSPWDPKNNDPYALQQRLSTSNKELQLVRTQLNDQTAKMKELESKVAVKEQELREYKEDYNRVLNAERAAEESKKARAADERLRTVQLEKKLEESRKELIEAKNNFEAYKKSIEKKADDRRASDKAVQALTEKLVKTNKELEDYKAQLKEKDEQIRLQGEAIDHESRRFDVLKQKFDQAEKLVRTGEKNFSGKDVSIQGLLGDLENAKIRERDYKSRLAVASSQLRESYKMVKSGESRLNDLKSQLAAKEKRIAALQKESDRLKAQLRERNSSPSPAASSTDKP